MRSVEGGRISSKRQDTKPNVKESGGWEEWMDLLDKSEKDRLVQQGSVRKKDSEKNYKQERVQKRLEDQGKLQEKKMAGEKDPWEQVDPEKLWDGLMAQEGWLRNLVQEGDARAKRGG